MRQYILLPVKVFVITFVLCFLALDVYLRFNMELQPCNSDTTAVHYYNNLPSNPPLKVDRRWV